MYEILRREAFSDTTFLWEVLGQPSRVWAPTPEAYPSLCAEVQRWLDQLAPDRQALMVTILEANDWIGVMPSEGVPYD